MSHTDYCLSISRYPGVVRRAIPKTSRLPSPGTVRAGTSDADVPVSERPQPASGTKTLERGVGEPGVGASAGRGRIEDRLPPELDESVRLEMVLLRLSRHLRTIDAGSGLTPAELSALSAIVRGGPVRPSDLAVHEGRNPTMVSRLLTRLVEDGSIRRQDDPTDGRGALFVATSRGRLLHRQVRAARAAVVASHLGCLPANQRQQISAAVPALEALEEQFGGVRS